MWFRVSFVICHCLSELHSPQQIGPRSIYTATGRVNEYHDQNRPLIGFNILLTYGQDNYLLAKHLSSQVLDPAGTQTRSSKFIR